MREQPTWRIPVGVLGIVLGLAIYGIVIAVLIAPWIGAWPALAQAPVYLVLGVAWILPLRRYLIWMETGRWG
ncbi:DUF2842 domain-containing protein [Novosphingobium sp. RD2P27]|uniref:DUF2842 domain-containing protein n=1 Tax=Novosphingobium kalidii TaxID=3230299 RepID=A0ABV2D3W5_9SPHN